jgi:flavodoxin
VQIQKATHGNLFEITPMIAYPTAYKQTTTIARREKEENARPALKTHVENMDEYDVIFLGYPTWWGDLPMAVYTFLQEYNFAGKTIILFGTSGGSGAPKTNAQLGNKIPNATIIQGINVKGSISQKDVDKWLKSIGFGK